MFLNISELINGFSQIGNVALSKDNAVWSTPEWSEEFKIEFDVIVEKELSNDWVNIMHMTTGNDNGLGARVPGVWANKNKYFHSCFHVNGDDDYCQDYDYQLDKLYHFEISQHNKPSQYYSTGEATYRIMVNGEVIHEIINTTPMKFQNVKLYLGNPWYETFAPYGTVSNLKINDLNKPGTYQSFSIYKLSIHNH